MSIVVAWSMLALTLVMGVLPIFLSIRFGQRLNQLRALPVVRQNHKVAIILPCKGLDPGFRENIMSWLNQELDNAMLVFVVATADDPAYFAISKLIEETRGTVRQSDVVLLVANIENVRAQKITNQLAAISHLGSKPDILVFVDSDIRPLPDMVSRLIAPLEDTGVGATTGIRWYDPPTPTLGSMLRSTWTAGALPMVVDPRTNFAFGGCMACKRTVFERARIAERWDRAVSDDFPFTLGIKELGLEVRFVPACTVVSYESSTVAETIEFTNRQSIISRIYFPSLWWMAALAHSSTNILLLYGLVSFVFWCASGSMAALIGSFCCLLLVLQMANAWLLIHKAQDLMPQLRKKLQLLLPHYMIAAPLTTLLSLVNTLYSLTTNRITWRGVCYEMRSPSETIVISSDNQK